MRTCECGETRCKYNDDEGWCTKEDLVMLDGMCEEFYGEHEIYTMEGIDGYAKLLIYRLLGDLIDEETTFRR